MDKTHWKTAKIFVKLNIHYFSLITLLLLKGNWHSSAIKQISHFGC